MKYKLNVSHNCGISYAVEQKSNNLGELRKAGKKLDEQHLRWDIEDEKGEQIECCAIHKGIIAFLVTANTKELDTVKQENPPKEIDQ